MFAQAFWSNGFKDQVVLNPQEGAAQQFPGPQALLPLGRLAQIEGPHLVGGRLGQVGQDLEVRRG